MFSIPTFVAAILDRGLWQSLSPPPFMLPFPPLGGVTDPALQFGVCIPISLAAILDRGSSIIDMP